nr:MAG TPA: hypothetical protein [Caudoviricetes sp.]
MAFTVPLLYHFFQVFLFPPLRHTYYLGDYIHLK